MRSSHLAGLLVAITACSSTPPAQAPGGAPRVLAYELITVGRRSGEGEIRIEADGTRRTHYTFNDRGRGPDVRTEATYTATGSLRTFRATGHDYLKAPVDERLEQRDGKQVWSSTAEHGEAAADAGFYLPFQQFDASLTSALLRAPGRRLKLLPAGEAWIEDDRWHEVDVAGTRRRLHQIAIGGLGFSPALLWLDEQGELFGTVSTWISTVPAGGAAVIPALIALDQAWTSARAARLAAQLAHRPPAAGLAITHARVFDSERGTVTPDATVVIVGDKITAVGNAATPVPAGAQVIDARGRTLVPGFWDMHVHAYDDDGLLHLASGVTSVRDLGNDPKELAARAARYDAGTEVGPRVLRAGLIDGPGPLAAPTGVLAGTAEEATAAVAKIADAGYVQVKMYSSLKPALVPVIAAAAHARGLRVSGHIPTGMNAAQAVEAGYDEIQHINFLFLQFLAGPDDDTRTPLRFTRVAEGAAGLDLAGPAVTSFLDLLVAHKTVIDPTLATFHDMFSTGPGELDPVYVPYEQRLPAQVLRNGRAGGLPADAGKRAQYRASYAAMLRMVKAAWDRKITIVPGTDATPGLSYTHELALYVQAGIPPADVLSLATLGAARVMGRDRELGSIAVGKRADVVLVDGDPTRDITAVRNTDVVVCRGVVYQPGELFTAVGMQPR